MTSLREQFIENTDKERARLQAAIDQLLPSIRTVPIANRALMPFGWRKAAKGRTVWRIIEEVISQNLEAHAKELGFETFDHAESEVGVYDFSYSFEQSQTSFVNIKSAVAGTRSSKDDISKAVRLLEHYEKYPQADFYIATFEMRFTSTPSVTIDDCVVMPLAWIPDVYVNPSNNGNLQSSHAKHLDKAIKRTNDEFLAELKSANEIAVQKRRKGR